MSVVDPASTNGSLTDSAILIDVLLRLSQTVRLRFNDWLSDFDLNDGRYLVLTLLSAANDSGCSQADLAERLGQSESNVSTLIERMQRDGLVQRLRSDADRRKRVLSISVEGQTLLSRVNDVRPKWADQLMREFSESSRTMLVTLLRQLGGVLDVAAERKSVVTYPKSRSDAPAIPNTDRNDPVTDPQSPQFALQQMLLALSSRSGAKSVEREVA